MADTRLFVVCGSSAVRSRVARDGGAVAADAAERPPGGVRRQHAERDAPLAVEEDRHVLEVHVVRHVGHVVAALRRQSHTKMLPRQQGRIFYPVTSLVRLF